MAKEAEEELFGGAFSREFSILRLGKGEETALFPNGGVLWPEAVVERREEFLALAAICKGKEGMGMGSAKTFEKIHRSFETFFSQAKASSSSKSCRQASSHPLSNCLVAAGERKGGFYFATGNQIWSLELTEENGGSGKRVAREDFNSSIAKCDKKEVNGILSDSSDKKDHSNTVLSDSSDKRELNTVSVDSAKSHAPILECQIEDSFRIEAMLYTNNMLIVANEFGDCYIFRQGKQIVLLKNEFPFTEAGQIFLSINDEDNNFLAVGAKRSRNCRIYSLKEESGFPLIHHLEFTKVPRAFSFFKCLLTHDLSLAIAFESHLELHELKTTTEKTTTTSREIIHQFPPSNSPITALATNNSYLAIGCKDGTCTIFTRKEPERLSTVQSISAPIHSQVDFIAFCNHKNEEKALWVASILEGEIALATLLEKNSKDNNCTSASSSCTADSRILGLVCREDAEFDCITLNYSFFQVKVSS